MRRFVLVLLTVFTIGTTRAGTTPPWADLADPVFVRVDARELPHPHVTSVTQDTSGFLWVGTEGGIARYDGYHFRTYAANAGDPSALPEGYVNTMLPGPDGALWLGTFSSGLSRFDPATETFRTWRAAVTGSGGPRSGTVYALAAAPGGNVWVGGDAGLDLFNPVSGRFDHIDLSNGAQPEVRSIFVGHNITWVGTARGLYAGHPGAKYFRHIKTGRLAEQTIDSLYEDGSGRLWAGSIDALFVLDRTGKIAASFASSAGDSSTLLPGAQECLIEVGSGVVWAGSNDGGISIVDLRAARVRRIAADQAGAGALTAGQTEQFLRDRSGLIWIANATGGLLAYNPHVRDIALVTAPRLRLGPLGAMSVAATARGGLWIGGYHGALTSIASGAPSQRITVPNGSSVIKLIEDDAGGLWIGTLKGLCRLPPGGAAAICPAGPHDAGGRVQAVVASDRQLWVGTMAGLWRQNLATGEVRRYFSSASSGASNRWVTSLYRDRTGHVWVGTRNGLNRLDPGAGRLVRVLFDPKNPSGIAGDISSILQDDGGRIWAGEIGGPLNVLSYARDGMASVRHLGVTDGMPHQNVGGLAQDATGRIWASTAKGIALFDSATLHARALGLVDGVSDGSYWSGAVSRAPDGTIFFGGHDGLTAIGPHAASPWEFMPPVVVSALSIARRNVPAWNANRGRTLDLPAGRHDITVEFAALDYSQPDALRYAYKLNGYDRDWVEADPNHRIATYTNLAPGHYTLLVRGTNRLGVWSDRTLALAIDALPAWYQTWWMRALFAVLLIACGYAAHLLRTAVLRTRQRELEAIVERRTRELFDANRALEEMSLTDPLTGLRNRRFLLQHVEEEVALCVRRYNDWLQSGSNDAPRDADMSFFIVDIDHFKVVNDELGHGAGDRVLAQMRERLQQVFRESDYLIRWGGEEFLAVARGSNRADAPEIAERLRQAVAGRPFTLEDEVPLAKTISIGFATFPFVPRDPKAVTWSQVVELLADQALYMAKRAGRNTWFGLAAGEGTDARALVRQLGASAEEAAAAGMLDVIRP